MILCHSKMSRHHLFELRSMALFRSIRTYDFSTPVKLASTSELLTIDFHMLYWANLLRILSCLFVGVLYPNLQ